MEGKPEVGNGHLATSSKIKPTPEPIPPKKTKKGSLPWNIGWKIWFHKYFWEGQALTRDIDFEAPENGKVYSTFWTRFVEKHRRPLSLIIPALTVHFFWWAITIKYQYFYLFKTKYLMSITMVFGSMIAGMTSEGGGAVAFPVMTLLLKVSPTDARDFSVLIQSVGMTAAMFTIFFMKVQIVWQAIVLGTIGGVIGLIAGLEYVDQLKYPAWKKMGFVSIWFSFAFALFLLNRYHKRKTYRIVPHFNLWKMAVLVVTGMVGGLFTSFAGSGMDVCIFSVLTLLFRVSEKTATPTSVVMMAIISIMGAFWRLVIMAEVTTETLEYMLVCVPIVVFGAPFGSVLGSHFHRQVLAGLIYLLDTIALITAFIVVDKTPLLVGASVAIIVVGFVFFFILTKLGTCLMERNLRKLGRQEVEEIEGIPTEPYLEETCNNYKVNLAFQEEANVITKF